MQPIIDGPEIKSCQALLCGMMETEAGRTFEFDVGWIRKSAWKVVPVEDTCHFAPAEITTIVSALQSTGYAECFAIASESVDPAPACFRLSVSEEAFREFNSECGALRYVVTDANRSWAISCNEWYNLFACKPDLLESLLGEPIDQARQEFLEFASLMAKGNADEPFMRIAERYAAF
jgi:hypothetical protein